jgi:hypothetical protein
VPPPTPKQQLRRRRFESVIALAAPLLDVVLATGDRLSRIGGPEDDYSPIRAPGEAFELGPAEPTERPAREAAD